MPGPGQLARPAIFGWPAAPGLRQRESRQNS